MPDVIKLTRLPSGYLLVHAEASPTNVERYSDRLPFLIDTASDRSLIVPAYQKNFDQLGINVGDRVHQNDTLIGTVRFRNAHNVQLHLLCADESNTVTVTLGKLPLVLPGQQFQGANLPDLEDPNERVHYNVLGLDVLRDFTLLVEGGPNGQAILIKDSPLIISRVAEFPEFRGRFGPTTFAPTVEIEPYEGREFHDISARANRDANTDIRLSRLPSWIVEGIKRGKPIKPKQQSKENRRDARCRTNPLIECSADLMAESNHSRVSEVSLGGIRFITSKRFAEGNLVMISPRDSIQGPGVVVRVKHCTRNQRGEYLVGAVFESESSSNSKQ